MNIEIPIKDTGKTRKMRKFLIVIILILIVLLLGVACFSYFSFSDVASITDIKIINGKLYPSYSPNTTEYYVYTGLSDVSIMCDTESKSVKGCDETVAVGKEKVTHKIVTKSGNKETTYNINIVRQNDNYSKIVKIDNIEGNPNTWVKSATIKIKTISRKGIEGNTYSFDGGKTWQDENNIAITENKTLQVLVKDYFGYTTTTETIIVDKIDNDKPKVTLTKTYLQPKKIRISAVAIDESSGIDSYNWNDDGYGKETTLDVTRAGTYVIRVKDKVGNESSEISINISEDDLKYTTEKEFVALFDSNGADKISSSTLKCRTNSKNCSVVAPEIIRNGYNIIGWSTNKNSKAAEFKVGDKITLSANKTYYAITNKSITLNFKQNGANKISSTTQSCKIYNESTSCSITIPTITPTSEFEVVGWSKVANKFTKDIAAGEKIIVASNGTYYAITKSTTVYKATFDKNGASKISSTSQSCYRYNGAKSCSVTTPTITATSGFSVVGWGNNAASTSKSVNQNSKLSLTGNKTYYAITKSTTAYKAIFDKNGASKISSTSKSCNRYNGATSCSIKTPTITATSGFSVVGWGNNAASTSKSVNQNSKLSLTGNKTYYAITKSTMAYKAIFDKNGASKISSTSKSCNRYNGATSCSIKTPTITAASGFNVVGWGTSASSQEKSVDVNSNLKISSNKTYYAITKSTVAYKATFDKNGASKISSTSQSCNRYNGATSCSIKTPTITAASGFSVVGWGNNAVSTSKSVNQNSNVTLNKNVTYYAVTKSTTVYTATFDKNGASKISSTSQSCNRYNGATSCSIKMPTITAAPGFSVLGWESSASATTKSVDQNVNITLTKDVKYYAITKSTAGYKVTFNKNGASKISSTSQSCYRYNGNKNCILKTPTITAASGFSVVGWGSSASATTKSVDQNTDITVTKDATYYAITKSTMAYKATFDKNGASKISSTSQSCNRYNGATSCSIKTPTITAASGFNVVGWGTSASSQEKSVDVNSNLKISSNKTYYAITRTPAYLVAFYDTNKSINDPIFEEHVFGYNGKKATVKTPSIKVNSKQEFIGWNTDRNVTSSSIKAGQTINITRGANYYSIIKETLTLTLNKNTASSLSFYKTSCISYGQGCTITESPYIYSPGNEIWGFSPNPNSGWGGIINTKITKDTTMYARTYNNYRKKPLNIVKTYNFDGFSVEVENSTKLPYNVYNKYYTIIDNYIYPNMPYLFDFKGKLNLVSDSSYVDTWGSSSAGMSYSVDEYVNVDVRLSSSFSEYSVGTIVHELGHAFDSYYRIKTGKALRDQPDFINLYNQYKNYGSSRPLRDYSYTNMGEFIADCFRYYFYYKYRPGIDSGGSITTGIVTAIEKHINIAKNGYK